MNFRFRKLNLASKLSLLFAFPVLICIMILVYFFSDTSIAEHTRLLLVGLPIILAYLVIAIYFAGKLTKDLKVIENVSAGLASGRQTSNGHAGALPEAQKIVGSIRKIQEDLHYQ